MTVKTCLLVTDDPDDHAAFSEALSEISSQTIVLIILDSEKALVLLRSGKSRPDYIILDLSMQGIRINSFLKVLKSADFMDIPTVVYGDEEGFSKIEHREGLTFFGKDYEYSDLRTFLRRFIPGEDGDG